MKKILSVLLIFLVIFLVGCSKNNVENTTFDYNVTLKVPKSAKIGIDAQLIENASPNYDEYKIAFTSQKNTVNFTVEGNYFESFEVALNPEVQALDCRSMAVLKNGEENKIIQTAATYLIGLYYGAQKGEKDIPFDSYVYSQLSEETAEKLNDYYSTIASSFCSFDDEGNLESHGMYDLMFSGYFGNVTKSENGLYCANVTLSYSYIFKHPEVSDNDVFTDITLSAYMTYENGKWVVADMENPLII